MAESIGILLHQVSTGEVEEPRYRVNDGTACLYCKTELYRTLGAVVERGQSMIASTPNPAQPQQEREDEQGTSSADGPRSRVIIYNGTNYDDLKDLTRLGLVAAREFQIQSPLQLCTKQTVRASVIWKGRN